MSLSSEHDEQLVREIVDEVMVASIEEEQENTQSDTLDFTGTLIADSKDSVDALRDHLDAKQEQQGLDLEYSGTVKDENIVDSFNDVGDIDQTDVDNMLSPDINHSISIGTLSDGAFPEKQDNSSENAAIGKDVPDSPPPVKNTIQDSSGNMDSSNILEQFDLSNDSRKELIEIEKAKEDIDENNKKEEEGIVGHFEMNIGEKGYQPHTPPAITQNAKQEEYDLDMSGHQQSLFNTATTDEEIPENGEESNIPINTEVKSGGGEDTDAGKPNGTSSSTTPGKTETKAKTKLCNIL